MKTIAARPPFFRQTWCWFLYGAVAVAASIASWRLFPVAFPVASLDIRMDRAAALREAARLAGALGWGPAGTARDVASFGVDGEAQAFLELEGGGKAVFTSLIHEGWYSPFRWRVRRCREGEAHRTLVFFRPDGAPNGFVETLKQDAPGPALAADAARDIAEAAARAEPWHLDFGPLVRLETSQVTRPGGRVDHTFVYEQSERRLGEGRLRLRLTVGGDRLTELTRYVHVPEAFTRRYAEMRSANNAIASAASGAMLLLYGVGGCGLGIFFLIQGRSLLWRPALAAAGILAGLQLLGSLNASPLAWMGYDTALSAAGFIAERQVALIAGALGMGLVFFLTFAAAEGLSRRAFPAQPQLWRLWSAPAAASPGALGRTAGGILLAPLHLFYVLAFYWVAVRWFGWWTPTEALVDPDMLAHVRPWVTPLVRAAQAGIWEEMLFRAVPLSAAALLGERFGQRRRWIVGALCLQALVFAAAHANYPGQPSYSRVIELIVPSLVFGAVFLRFGLLPAILSHFVYDVILMALPLFAATAPGIWLDRLALIGVTLLPLWIVLGRRWRHGPAGADALPRNGTWEPPPALPVESSRPPWATSPGRISRRTGWTLLLLAAAGLAFWLQSTPWRHLGPPLTIDRAAAERIARAAWQERGVQLPPAARALISVTPRPGSVDRYVWQKVGSSGYEALLGTHVPVARWLVRFARFDGDVAERAEEWWCFVTGDGKVQRLRHTLPEARAGATLDESAARAIAERTLRERFGIDPTQWEKVSATSRQRPKRTDWTFLYRDPQFPRLKPGEARATVEVAGEEAIEAYRSIFVPEEWEREQRRASTVYRIGGTIRATALGLLLVAGLVVAVLAVTRRRIAVGLALGVAAVVVGARLIGLVNSWPSIVAGFSTTRPYDLQRLIGAAGPTVGALLAASALALIAGTAARWLRPPLPDRRAATGLGLLAGVIGVGLLALGAALAEVPAPDWPSFAGAEAWLPPLGAAPFIVSGYVAQTVVAVLVFGAVDRWSAGWSLRRGVAGAALGGAAALLFLGGEAPGIAAWCGSAALVGAGLVALYVLALRQDLTVLPLATGVVAIAGALAGAAPRHHPHAWTSALLGCVVVSLLAWTGFTALRALASRPTDPQVTPATPPPPPPLPPGA